MRTLSLTRALKELKLINDRIEKAVSSGKFVSISQINSNKVGTMDKKKFEEAAKDSEKSIRALMKNYTLIKSAIVDANAKTCVEVDGKNMTIAAAIERKNHIQYEKQFLSELKRQLQKAQAECARKNDEVEQKLHAMLLEGSKSDKQKAMSEDIKPLSDAYLNRNSWELVDPLNLQDIIETMETDIMGFEANVDLALSEINAITKIEIEE